MIDKVTLEQIVKEYAKRAPLTEREKWQLYLQIPEMFGRMNNEKSENKRKR